MESLETEPIYNRFEGYKFGDTYEWVAIHDEHLHFNDNTRPQIKLCGTTLKIRANDAWTKLPRYIKQVMVAHELGHRHMGHASLSAPNPFYRMGRVIYGEVDPKELEADEYATRLLDCNTVREVLKELSDFPHTSDMARKEYLLRAEAITPIH